MDLMETHLIKNCSPTLASLKLANLFNCAYSTDLELEESIRYWNNRMSDKGIALFLLRKTEKGALIYVCRLSGLERELQRSRTARFLNQYGYEGLDAVGAIERLKLRLQCSGEFPHEIGVFLGYPLEDVTGFINNSGRGFLRSGFWKVYGNLEEAEKKFYKFKKCTDIYMHLWEGGKSVWQLTVAA